MQLEKTPFYNEVMDIAGKGGNSAQYDWTAALSANGKTVYVHQVTDFNIKRDYINNYADAITVNLLIFVGDLFYDVLPNRDNLEITMTRAPIFGGGDSYKYAYKAVAGNIPDLKISNQKTSVISQDAMNLAPPVVIQFTLARKSILSIKGMQVGVTYRRTRPSDAVLNIMTTAVQEAKTSTDDQITGVEMETPDNQDATEHVILPHPTDVIDVPGYVQKNCNGIYNNGIGFYFQENTLHIYPTFDTSKFSSKSNTLTIYKLPTARYDLVDFTYRKNGGNLCVLASGTPYKENTSTEEQLNKGVGVRYTDASKIMGSSTEIKNNQVLMSRGDINTEFIANKRDDGFNAAYTGDVPITSNSFAERSKVSARRGNMLAVTWDYCDPELITPCMPVKVIVLDGDTVKEITGVVLCVDAQYQIMGNGPTAKRHKCGCRLYIYYDSVTDRN